MTEALCLTREDIAYLKSLPSGPEIVERKIAAGEFAVMGEEVCGNGNENQKN